MTKFLFDKHNNKFQISEGVYKFTIFKYKDVNITKDEITYNVEFDDFYMYGGKVQNAHEDELMEFVNNEALDIIKQVIKAQAVIDKLVENKV